MDEIFLKCFNMSFAASWVILAVILLRVILKKAPGKLRCLLWIPVAVRLIVPVSVKSTVSLLPSGEVLPLSELLEAAPQLQTGIPEWDASVNPTFAQTFAPGVGDSVNPLQVLTWVCGWIWILGMCTMALYSVISVWKLHRQVRSAIPVEKGVYLCDGLASPFILGAFRPRIYLPSDMEPGQREIVLVHERTHLQRGDTLWKPLGFLILAVHWFNPLAWLGYVLFCRDIELACDEQAVADMDHDRRLVYTQTLLDWSAVRASVSACPLAFGEVGIKKRIRAVLKYRKPSLWIAAGAMAALVILAVCFLTDPAEPTGGSLVPPGTEQGNNPIIQGSSALDINAITPFDVSWNRHCIGQVIYDDPSDRFICPTDNTYLFDFEIPYELLVYVPEQKTYQWQGLAVRLSLSESNFDICFGSQDGWETGFDPVSLRENNHAAWRVSVSDADALMTFYILQQKDGAMILAMAQNPVESGTWPRVLCVFTLEGLHGDYRGAATDALYSDIDADGTEEACFLTRGPTSGLPSFGVLIKENGTAVYNGWFYGWAYGFCYDSQGRLQISSDLGPLDIRIEDGKLVLYQNGNVYGREL